MDIKKTLEIGSKIKCHCDFCQEIIYIKENQNNVCVECKYFFDTEVKPIYLTTIKTITKH